MLKYFLLLSVLVVDLFGMIDLSKTQSEDAMNLLVDKKVVLLYIDGNFKYIKVMKKERKKGRVSKSNMFDLLHEDEEDYHLRINDENMDLSKVYIQENSKSEKWVRLGSLIDKKLFIESLNHTIFVYQERTNIIPIENDYEEVGIVRVMYAMNNSAMTLMVNEDDKHFNNAKVYEQLERVKSF